MSNIKIGNETEKTVSSVFRKYGYWVYNCPKSQSGSQPFDLIAIKGGEKYVVWFVDGKHVRENEVSFPLDRIEPNQWVSMEYANGFAKIDAKTMGFAIKFERTEEFYWLPYQTALEMRENDIKSININKLELLEGVIDAHTNK